MKTRLIGIVLAALAAFSLTGCAKHVDIQKANAKLVPGTTSLYYMCHGTTLIYFESMTGEDEYEAFFAWGCNPDGTMADAFIDPTREAQGNGEK
jgi:hypothetical protein